MALSAEQSQKVHNSLFPIPFNPTPPHPPPHRNNPRVCAVYAAVTESIRSTGMEATPTAYWAALMSTLELSSSKVEEAQAVAAITYLIRLVSPQCV